MPELELKANEPTFTPVPLDAPDPLPDFELQRRVNEAMAAESERHRDLRNSESWRMWSRDSYKTDMKNARRSAIQAWNDEQVNR